jgi:hypothetical protein
MLGNFLGDRLKRFMGEVYQGAQWQGAHRVRVTEVMLDEVGFLTGSKCHWRVRSKS